MESFVIRTVWGEHLCSVHVREAGSCKYELAWFNRERSSSLAYTADHNLAQVSYAWLSSKWLGVGPEEPCRLTMMSICQLRYFVA